MNDNNLIPFNERTESEQREIARKGGKASSEARRERRAIREALIERMGAKDLDEICDGMIERAKRSDRGVIVLRDTLGEKLPTKIEPIIDLAEVAAEVEKMVLGSD